MSEQPWVFGKSAATPNNMPGAAAPVDPAAPEPTAAAPAETVTEKAPPWGSDDEFKPDKAWKLISNLRDELDQYKSKADPVLAEHEALRRASQTELDRAKEDIAAFEARESRWRAEAIKSKAESLAAGKFVDSETALALIGDLTQFATDDGIDTQKLVVRLDQLAADKPFLVAPPAQQGFTPNRGQGTSGNGPITAAQVAQHAEGQKNWKAASSAKAQQLIQLHNTL